MALIGEKLASNIALYEVLCVCSGRGPKKTSTEGLTYKGPSCSVMATKTNVYFSQELPPFFFGDTPLECSGSTFLL